MRRMYSKEQLQKLIDEVSRLIAIEELDKVVPLPAIEKAGYVMTVNAAGTGYELKNVSGVVDGATIRPANVLATTKITAAEIVEDMSGYSFTSGMNSSWFEYEFAYAGVVKNGNKITFAVSLKLKKIDNAATNISVGAFTIPSAIANKLIPIELGDYSYLDQKEVSLFSGIETHIQTTARLSKNNNVLNLYMSPSGLVLNTTYVARYEATFLLNDSLAS